MTWKHNHNRISIIKFRWAQLDGQHHTMNPNWYCFQSSWASESVKSLLEDNSFDTVYMQNTALWLQLIN